MAAIYSDEVKQYICDAAKSADNYYQSAITSKHTRITANATRIQPIAPNLWRISLSQKLKHTDNICLCINSSLIPHDLYEDFPNRYISNKYFKIVKNNHERAELVIEVTSDMVSLFAQLPPHDIVFVSDLKFLIEKVRSWYLTYGHHIRYPSIPCLTQEDIYTRGYESENQIKAVQTALFNPISYIWGAPGTGKTQIVLANCIMSYIKQKKQVFILAPTNNAIEQTLRAVIHALEEAGQDIDVLYRPGISSQSFSNEYGKICDTIDRQEQIESLTNEIKELKCQQENFSHAQEILKAYEAFHDLALTYREKTEEQQDCQESIEELQKRAALLSDEIPAFRQTLSDLCKKEIQIKRREESLSFKIKKLFTEKEATFLRSEKDLVAAKIISCNTTIAEKENEQAAVNHTLHDKKQIACELEADILATFESAKSIAVPVLEHFRTIEEAMTDFTQIAATFSEVTIDPLLPQIIEEKESRLQTLKENASRKVSGKLVFAFTVDYFFSHFKSFGEIGIQSNLIAHVFLDEAAYCPFIKAGILFSLGAPVTLLGDHMQLPPICEAGEKTIHNQEQKIFLWSLSAIYSSMIFEKGFSTDMLFSIFENNALELPANLSVAFLPHTFRFGNNLAQILDAFVYQNGFTGQSDFNTEIAVIHAEKDSKDEKRQSSGEAKAIRSYIERNNLQAGDYVITTPYRDQRKYIIDTLHAIADVDNILTIHSSQGREWDTVFISVVDTYRNKWFTDSSKPQGLYTINTAISRAKKKIVIVCNRNEWNRNSSMQLIGTLINSATELV